MPCVAAETLERLAQVLLVVVHHLVGAMLTGKRELVVARCAGDHARAHELAELDGSEPHAARGAEHGERLARLQVRAVLERVVAGSVGDGQRGGAIEVELGGDLAERVGRDRDAFARRAEIGIAHHAVAGRQAGHAGADAFHHARKLASRRERERRLDLVFAGDHQRIEEIQPDRGNLGDDLAGPCRRLGDIREHEVAGWAEAMAEDGFHGGAAAPG